MNCNRSYVNVVSPSLSFSLTGRECIQVATLDEGMIHIWSWTGRDGARFHSATQNGVQFFLEISI